jgi:hypothetical protein
VAAAGFFISREGIPSPVDGLGNVEKRDFIEGPLQTPWPLQGVIGFYGAPCKQWMPPLAIPVNFLKEGWRRRAFLFQGKVSQAL